MYIFIYLCVYFLEPLFGIAYLLHWIALFISQ